MSKLVELQYNPFLPRLQVLIDGKPPSDYSRMIQYADESIWCWADKILDVIYTEIMDVFSVVFTGTDLDAAVMRLVCGRREYCNGFSARKFAVSDTLQERMKKLNQLIKRNSGISYKKTTVDASFAFQFQLSELMDSVQAIDIHNLFCSVKVSVISSYKEWQAKENGVLFLVTDDRNIEEQVQALHSRNPAFVIVIGQRNRLVEVREWAWVLETTQEFFLDTLYQCFLQEPLLWAFRNCARSIGKIEQYKDEIQRLWNTEPVIHITLDEKIEVGKSVKIRIISESEEENVPELIYRIPEREVAYCNGLCVFGVKEGAAALEIYRYGDKIPFCTKKFTVIKRNRITQIFLSEDSMLLGVGDKMQLSCSYFPENADNADAVIWTSSDMDIVTIDSNGNLTAVKEGQCIVICSAENVSAKCHCQVRPYLKEIRIDTPLENGVLYLKPMEEKRLHLCCVPENCLDGEIKIMSSDYDVVNVIGNVLYAKNKGSASLTISNSSGRVRRVIGVEIRANEQKKGGFIESLFHKIWKE